MGGSQHSSSFLNVGGVYILGCPCISIVDIGEFSLLAKPGFCYGGPECITILVRGTAVTFYINMNMSYIGLLLLSETVAPKVCFPRGSVNTFL